jgi:replication-associated recombination protein RarA
MDYNLNEILLVDEFRPKTIDEVILPPRYKTIFQDYVNAKGCPNLLLSGPKGIGKTTLVLAMVDQIGCNFLKINASLKGIDVIRNEVRDFAAAANGASILFDEDVTVKRVVLFDEFDGMSKAGQEALRGFIEEFQHNCIFIFTCNYKEKIIEAIYSRCKCIDFSIRQDEHQTLMKQFFAATLRVLDAVKIEYDKSVVAALIKQKFPDFRAVLNEIQGYSMSGKLDASILADIETGDMNALAGFLKGGKWDEMRKWVGSNGNMDEGMVLRKMASVEFMDKYIVKASQPDALEYIEEYSDRMGRSRDPQITLAALCTGLMKSIKWK